METHSCLRQQMARLNYCSRPNRRKHFVISVMPVCCCPVFVVHKQITLFQTIYLSCILHQTPINAPLGSSRTYRVLMCWVVKTFFFFLQSIFHLFTTLKTADAPNPEESPDFSPFMHLHIPLINHRDTECSRTRNSPPAPALSSYYNPFDGAFSPRRN